MPTVAEMELLNRSMSDLGNTFQRNRALTAQDREREAQARLNEEMMRLRREDSAAQNADRADARENRALSLKSQEAHQQRMQAYQQQLAAAKDEEAKWGVLQQMGKDGMLTEEGVAAMNEAFSKKLGEVGIGVKLFKLPTATDNKPQTWTHPDTGEKFVYNPRTGNFEKSENPSMTTISDDVDPETGEITSRKVNRRLTPADLKAAMEEERRAKADKAEEANAAAGPTLDEQAQMEEILSRPAVNASQPAAAIKKRVQQLEGATGELDIPATQLTNAPIARAGAPGEIPTFATEAEARQAGKKAGDIVRLVINGKPTRVRLK